MNLGTSQARGLVHLMQRLFAEEKQTSAKQYLDVHGGLASLEHHVNVFCWYARHLKPSSVVLDWGCNYGPDSCLIRSALGDDVEIHGCDFYEGQAFPRFRDYSRSRYQKLSDMVKLPYGDSQFDVIIGSGTLEHVAMDYESLKEIHRVLKPDGLLIITYLPYFLSWSEWYRRQVRKKSFHQRLYKRGELSQLLKRTGLYPESIGYHTHIPNVVNRSPLTRMKSLAARVLPLPFRHNTLCCVARRVTMMR